MPERHTCPSCAAAEGSPFYSVGAVPVQSSVVVTNAKQALEIPTGDVVLAHCEACGLVWNLAFDPRHDVVAGSYEDQQGFSPTFSEYSRQLAGELVETYGLRGKTVLEIGCGKGDFLGLICTMGNNRGVGVDPIGRADRIDPSFRERVSIEQERYAPHHARHRPDAIVCRHTLEHIADTGAFLRLVRSTMDPAGESVAVFEVPDVTRVLREAAFWDVYYEHCTYFTASSLSRAFRASGFEVLDVQRVYDDQYLIIHARAAAGTPPPNEHSAGCDGDAALPVERFASAVEARVDSWRERIAARGKQSVAVWGSGSKCVAFVSTLGISDEIACVVDINPYRQGRYAPGIPRPVVAPEQLRSEDPGLIIVMNPIYLDEITEMVRSMGIDAEVDAL